MHFRLRNLGYGTFRLWKLGDAIILKDCGILVIVKLRLWKLGTLLLVQKIAESWPLHILIVESWTLILSEMGKRNRLCNVGHGLTLNNLWLKDCAFLEPKIVQCWAWTNFAQSLALRMHNLLINGWKSKVSEMGKIN